MTCKEMEKRLEEIGNECNEAVIKSGKGELLSEYDAVLGELEKFRFLRKKIFDVLCFFLGILLGFKLGGCV